MKRPSQTSLARPRRPTQRPARRPQPMYLVMAKAPLPNLAGPGDVDVDAFEVVPKDEKDGEVSTVAAWGFAAIAVVAITLGVLIFLCRRPTPAAPAALPPPPPAPPSGGGLSGPSLRQYASPQMYTRALPAISDTSQNGLRVATAYDKGMTEVTLRCVGPLQTGAFAVVGPDPLGVSQVDPTFPAGNIFTVPAGSETRRVILHPGQSLYAKGSVTDTLLSVHATQAW